MLFENFCSLRVKKENSSWSHGSFVKDDNQNKKFMISKNFNKRSFLVEYRLINLAKKEPR